MKQKKSQKSKAEKSIPWPQIEEKVEKQQPFFLLVIGKFFEGLRNLSVVVLFSMLSVKYKDLERLSFFQISHYVSQ